MKVKCINPTKCLIKNKVYEAEKRLIHKGWYASEQGNRKSYREAYIIKVNEYLSVTVSPKRFITI